MKAGLLNLLSLLKLKGVGQSHVRDKFMKADNCILGKYLAEVAEEDMSDLENIKFQSTEHRISINGREIGEWDKSNRWLVENKNCSNSVR